MIRKLSLVLALFLLAACKKEEPAPSPTEVNVVPAPQPTITTAAVPAEPVVDLDSIPVEEDFEEEAEKEVTAANLTKKLDELEKEISAE
jgi:hypothetical protein